MTMIDDLTAKQNNKCAICGEQFNYKKKRIYDPIGHGLLCYDCKEGLNAFNHDPQLIEKAIKYKLDWWSKVVDMNIIKEGS